MVWSPSQPQQTQQLPAVLADALALRHGFNADATVPRLLFLVSPTCEICVSGALSVTQAVLSLPSTSDFRLYIVWLPVLANDTRQAAAGVQEQLPVDHRLAHFWDHDLSVSQAYHRVLQLGQRQRRHRVAWDMFLLYGAGVVWLDTPPVPGFWMHQLFLDDVPKLDTSILRDQLEQMLRGIANRETCR
jgi:hypothetical protein